MPQLIDFDNEEQSSKASAGELDERDIEAMNNLISPILASTESSSPEQEKSEEERKSEEEGKKLSDEEVCGDEIYGGERSDSPVAESNQKAAMSSEEEMKENIIPAAKQTPEILA